MNKRTAALILIKDLVVVHCTYQRMTARKTNQHYTFVAREEWLNPLMEPGTLLLAQNRTLDRLTVVQFEEFGDITDLDFDDERIEYKFILGQISASHLERLEDAEQAVSNTLKLVKHQQIEALRQYASNFLNDPDFSLLGKD